MNSDPEMAQVRREFFYRILSHIRARGSKPKRWFVRFDIWWLVRLSWIDDRFSPLRKMLNSGADHAKVDPDCPYPNFLFVGIPICINLPKPNERRPETSPGRRLGLL